MADRQAPLAPDPLQTFVHRPRIYMKSRIKVFTKSSYKLGTINRRTSPYGYDILFDDGTHEDMNLLTRNDWEFVEKDIEKRREAHRRAFGSPSNNTILIPQTPPLPLRSVPAEAVTYTPAAPSAKNVRRQTAKNGKQPVRSPSIRPSKEASTRSNPTPRPSSRPADQIRQPDEHHLVTQPNQLDSSTTRFQGYRTAENVNRPGARPSIRPPKEALKSPNPPSLPSTAAKQIQQPKDLHLVSHSNQPTSLTTRLQGGQAAENVNQPGRNPSIRRLKKVSKRSNPTSRPPKSAKQRQQPEERQSQSKQPASSTARLPDYQTAEKFNRPGPHPSILPTMRALKAPNPPSLPSTAANQSQQPKDLHLVSQSNQPASSITRLPGYQTARKVNRLRPNPSIRRLKKVPISSNAASPPSRSANQSQQPEDRRLVSQSNLPASSNTRLRRYQTAKNGNQPGRKPSTRQSKKILLTRSELESLLSGVINQNQKPGDRHLDSLSNEIAEPSVSKPQRDEERRNQPDADHSISPSDKLLVPPPAMPGSQAIKHHRQADSPSPPPPTKESSLVKLALPYHVFPANHLGAPGNTGNENEFIAQMKYRVTPPKWALAHSRKRPSQNSTKEVSARTGHDCVTCGSLPFKEKYTMNFRERQHDQEAEHDVRAPDTEGRTSSAVDAGDTTGDKSSGDFELNKKLERFSDPIHRGRKKTDTSAANHRLKSQSPMKTPRKEGKVLQARASAERPGRTANGDIISPNRPRRERLSEGELSSKAKELGVRNQVRQEHFEIPDTRKKAGTVTQTPMIAADSASGVVTSPVPAEEERVSEVESRERRFVRADAMQGSTVSADPATNAPPREVGPQEKPLSAVQGPRRKRLRLKAQEARLNAGKRIGKASISAVGKLKKKKRLEALCKLKEAEAAEASEISADPASGTVTSPISARVERLSEVERLESRLNGVDAQKKHSGEVAAKKTKNKTNKSAAIRSIKKVRFAPTPKEKQSVTPASVRAADPARKTVEASDPVVEPENQTDEVNAACEQESQTSEDVPSPSPARKKRMREVERREMPPREAKRRNISRLSNTPTRNARRSNLGRRDDNGRIPKQCGLEQRRSPRIVTTRVKEKLQKQIESILKETTDQLVFRVMTRKDVADLWGILDKRALHKNYYEELKDVLDKYIEKKIPETAKIAAQISGIDVHDPHRDVAFLMEDNLRSASDIFGNMRIREVVKAIERKRKESNGRQVPASDPAGPDIVERTAEFWQQVSMKD